MSCWHWAQVFTDFHLWINIPLCRLINCILRWFLGYSVYTLAAGSFPCGVFQSSFLRAPSSQLLCIISLKETGSVPAARCCHRAEMAGLAPPPLLWHECPSVELKAASRPFRSPIIDQEWQRICTALNVFYVYTVYKYGFDHYYYHYLLFFKQWFLDLRFTKANFSLVANGHGFCWLKWQTIAAY